jgi:hypothetical protein
MKIFLVILLILSFIIMAVTFFSPIIIALVTGNWWYLFLFIVTPIPTMAEIIVFTGLLDIYEK